MRSPPKTRRMLVVRFTANSKSRRMVVVGIATALMQSAVVAEVEPQRSSASGAETKFTAIQLWSGFDVVKSQRRIVTRVNQYRLGMAAPISADGYCLTAAHVVETEPVATLHLQGSPNSPLSFERTTRDGMVRFFRGFTTRPQAERPSALQLNGVRVIHRFKDADLAVVKVDFATPRYFRFADIPRANESFIVRANSCERNPSAWWMKSDHAHLRATFDATGRFWTGELSIPATEGDSGSPVFNRSGVLHGILIEKYVPPIWWPFANRGQPIVRYQGVSSKVLNQIMEVDRSRSDQNIARRRTNDRPF
jgi:hypothetical protein